MKRRELIKSIGLLTITGSSMMLMASCGKTEQEEKVLETAKEPEKTEREKLIINRTEMAIQDPNNPTELELKHTPEIVLQEKDERGFTKVNITVGSKGVIHPTENNHWIDYIKLYLDDKLIATTETEIGAAQGYNSFSVRLDGVKTIRAEIGCNLHGIWHNTLTLS